MFSIVTTWFVILCLYNYADEATAQATSRLYSSKQSEGEYCHYPFPLPVFSPPPEPKLPVLMNEVAASIPHLWRAVGDQLEVPSAVLESFFTQHLGNPMECFREVFIYWRDNNTKAYSWASLVEVLQSPQVGQVALAKHIRNIHDL